MAGLHIPDRDDPNKTALDVEYSLGTGEPWWVEVDDVLLLQTRPDIHLPVKEVEGWQDKLREAIFKHELNVMDKRPRKPGQMPRWPHAFVFQLLKPDEFVIIE